MPTRRRGNGRNATAPANAVDRRKHFRYTKAMARSRHPNKHIEEAVQHAESLGWRFELSPGHAWGHLLCPLATREGCIVPVWSTPRNPEAHARTVLKRLGKCPHQAATTETNGD